MLSSEKATFDEAKKRYALLKQFEESENYKKMNDLVAQHHELENDYLYAVNKLMNLTDNIEEKQTEQPESKDEVIQIYNDLPKDMVSPNFKISEFENSNTAKSLGIPNKMSDKQINQAKFLAYYILEPIRDYYESPVIITSGFRCEELNSKISSSSTSDHLYSEVTCSAAADIKVNGVEIKTLFNDLISGRIKINQKYMNQIIIEFDQNIIHTAIRLVSPKREFLKRYVSSGRTFYDRVSKEI